MSSKLDMSQAYAQFGLDEESKKYTVINMLQLLLMCDVTVFAANCSFIWTLLPHLLTEVHDSSGLDVSTSNYCT